MKILYFAWIRERIGKAEEEIELPASVVTVSDLVRFLSGRGEEYANALQNAKVVRESMEAAGQLAAHDALERAVEANVIVQLDHLRSHPSVAHKLGGGHIKLHGWVYHIATGQVTSYDEGRREFVPL